MIFYVITMLISSWSREKIPRSEAPRSRSRSRSRPTPSRSRTRSRSQIADLETGLEIKIDLEIPNTAAYRLESGSALECYEIVSEPTPTRDASHLPCHRILRQRLSVCWRCQSWPGRLCCSVSASSRIASGLKRDPWNTGNYFCWIYLFDELIMYKQNLSMLYSHSVELKP